MPSPSIVQHEQQRAAMLQHLSDLLAELQATESLQLISRIPADLPGQLANQLTLPAASQPASGLDVDCQSCATHVIPLACCTRGCIGEHMATSH